jgi:N12 class adenine-specific DNA methylase
MAANTSSVVDDLDDYLVNDEELDNILSSLNWKRYQRKLQKLYVHFVQKFAYLSVV